MSIYIWLPVVLLSILVVWLTFYTYDKKFASRHQVARGNVLHTGDNSAHSPRVVNTNNTVIYTIPTTQQLTVQYPSLTQTQSNTAGVRTSDAPPSYDQAIIGAPPPALVTTQRTRIYS